METQTQLIENFRLRKVIKFKSGRAVQVKVGEKFSPMPQNTLASWT
jgi:hypothetical protein